MNKNGLHGWIFQRISTVMITVYTLVYLSLLLTMQNPDFATWKSIHDALWFKVYSTATLVIVMANSCLAGWQIGTDYTQKVPIAGFGAVFHGFYTIVSILLLLTGLFIFWMV